MTKGECWSDVNEILTYLLVRIHRSKTAVMAGLTTLTCNFLHLLLGAVGEVSWIVVARHIYGFGK
jgi:hypothetical protein